MHWTKANIHVYLFRAENVGMSKSAKPNRISRWIEQRNYATCLRIARMYYRRKEQGRRMPLFKFSFLVAILQRFLWVFLLLFRSRRNSFIPYKDRPFSDLCKRLVGISRFEIPGLLPNRSDFPAFSFPKQTGVQVSIVICVHNHIGYTYNCLLSILQNTRAVSYEVIVVNDCSTDNTSAVLATIENITVIENHENLGFLKSCNLALASATGEYVCFLNNDIQVQPGWLTNLIAPFNQFDDVGLVGGKLIYPYGLLQEAGGIVNYRGEPANYGKFNDPEDIHYNYLRQTDYCSGACIVLTRQDLDVLGGFDEQFAPAYYEDTDLAFRVRYQLHKKVYYQPLARVVHFEGVSSGKISDGTNVKRYQLVNAHKFRRKWQHVFETFPQTVAHTAVARKFVGESKHVLIVEPLLPTFDQDSGSRRMFELIKLFQQLNWQVIYSAEARTQEEPYYSTLVNRGVWVLNKSAFQKRSTRVIRQVAPFTDIAWVSRPHMNRRYGPLMKRLGIRWINDTVDIHFVREERALEVGAMDKGKSKKVLRRKQRELTLMRAADDVITVTKTEADLLGEYGIKHVSVVPNVHYPAATSFPAFGERRDICFIGGYRHQPNVDAAKWMVEEIMPLVWKQMPSLNIYLLGSLPPPSVTALRTDRVHVPGYLPSVDSYFLSTRIFVAPLRFGAGMKGKIGQSFEFGLPVITTDVGAEGMGLTDREHYLRANTAMTFANAILELYNNQMLWEKLSAGGINALAPYSPDCVKDTLRGLLTYSN